jgi:hypothetical protein
MDASWPKPPCIRHLSGASSTSTWNSTGDVSTFLEAAVRRAVLLILAVLFVAGAILFDLAWYDRYWRWRDCFNELGRC